MAVLEAERFAPLGGHFFFWFGLVMGGFTCGFYIAMVYFAEVGVGEVSFLFFCLFWRGRACVYKGMDD